jgi:hypothetical protein
MKLDRNPMPARQATWITTTVLNTGRDDLEWGSDGCGVTVGVYGTMNDFSWRGGLQQVGPYLAFKKWALDRVPEGAVYVGFLPGTLVSQGVEVGAYGCGDVFIGHRLSAGKQIVQRARWDGFATFVHAPPPTGRVTLTGSFTPYWRKGEPEPHSARIDISLDAWVTGVADPPVVHPAEAVDIALADPDFGSWLLSRPNRSGAGTIVRFDPAAHTWRVGLLSYYPVERTRVAIIDATTGELLGVTGPVD